MITHAPPAFEGESPTVSVLMAVYNTPENFINSSIASIIGQSLQDLELVIIDDGSDESTSCLLRAWAKQDPRIRLHKLPTNVGLTKALNIGLQLVKGTYVARQDSDDISSNNRLASQKRFLESHPEFDAAGTDTLLIDSVGNPIGSVKIDPALENLAQRNLLVHGSMIFRRSVFNELGGYNETMKLAQDYELYLRMLRKHNMRIGVVQGEHYFLRQHSTSLSSRHMFRQLYYSVMAKTLNQRSNSSIVRKLFFFWHLTVDYFITHRLFLSAFIRRLLPKHSQISLPPETR